MRNPVDEFLCMQKTAGPAEAAINPVAMALWGAAAAGVGAAASNIYQAVSKRRDFKSMMELAPDLSEVQASNPKMFNAVYSSFRNINPTYAADPLVAGAYMRNFMDNPGTAGLAIAQTVKQPDAPGRGAATLSTSFGLGPISFKKSFG